MDSLLPRHLEDLQKSTLREDTIVKYGIVSLSEQEVRARLNRQDISGGGYLLPFPSSHFYQVKLDNPLPDCKYLSPAGMEIDLFVTHLARDKQQNITIPFFFTEGPKKALSMEQLGYAAIGLCGVWGWKSKGCIHKALNDLALKDRVCYIVFDSDKYSNDHVLKAEYLFAQYLIRRGAAVKIINLAPGLGKGIDDQIKRLKDDGNLEDLKKQYIETAQDGKDYVARAQDKFSKDIDKSKSTLPALIAENIRIKYQLIYGAENFYAYKDGAYRNTSEEAVRRWILEETGVKISFNKTTEILNFVKTLAYIETEKLNQSPLLNLKNGLFNIETYELSKHTPEIYSTIQLPVSYNPEAKCEKWIKTLCEVLEGNEEKAEILQEFFGLMLTRETRYEKALLLIGDGANGKSVILNTIEHLIGKENCTSIPLEKFSDLHYMASLFGKLANISIETNAKSEVYDSTFKAVISGEPIQADPKFKKPFKFRPFCKLVFAMNNLPRVDDKTNAFFRRLLIVRFNREFAEEEQNKRLKEELLTELDGIFNFCIEGLKRLKARTIFNITKQIQAEIDEYRKENNNVLVFVEEECSLDPSLSIEKGELYDMYTLFCEKSGYRPLSKKKFGISILKHFENKGVSDDRNYSLGRIWRGIGKVIAAAYCL